jgi:hypothetical protein
LEIEGGKNICTEISLNQIEDLYEQADYWVLQMMRDNSTARFHDGTMKTGAAPANWSIDGMIKNLHHCYKFMSFKNTKDDWVKHSINMPSTIM